MPDADQPPHAGSPYRENRSVRLADRPPLEAAIRWTTLLLLALAAVVLWMASVAWREHQLSAAVAALPRDVQQQTFGHLRDELSHLCAADKQPLEDRCREQASFILKFPQCDAACQRIAMPFLTDGARK